VDEWVELRDAGAEDRHIHPASREPVMTTTAKPTNRRFDPIATHIYVVPVVHELPVVVSAGCWDATW